MKEKIKKVVFGYLPGFVLGVITVFSISVIAATYFPSNDVTYDNKESGLSSTNVQGAIDELYGVCTTPSTAGDTILKKEPIVTSGDGLYKDDYEDRYFYKGKNVNNYVTFNNEKAGWRIISINSDGTIKIIKTYSIGAMIFDSSYSNWSRPASLNTYLNGDYYNSLNIETQKLIVSHSWSIGEIVMDNNNLGQQIIDENSKKWNGKIALPTLSEFLRTHSLPDKCGTYYIMDNNTNRNQCLQDTWMQLGTDISYGSWTLSVVPAGNVIPNAMGMGIDLASPYIKENVFPVLYLSSDIKITDGDGSQSNPYEISL